MISSRQDNQQNGNNFWDTYEHLCALQNLLPMQSLKTSLSSDGGSNLIINADKLKSTDWDPLLGAIKVNKTLRTISFHSSYIPPENDPKEASKIMRGYAKTKKPPSIRNKEKTNKLCRSLKDCVSISHNLVKLELYNIPLTAKDCAQLAKGLRSSKSLKVLSFDRCLIGDEGLEIICRDIQGLSNLNRVNFSSCNLTHEGANILASLIKVQALKRHNEAWKDSLRYGRPDLDSMFGIRRITINSNPLIGDAGVQSLADAFKSDLWLKALDLQNCGITTVGANYLLDGLKFNAMMHVLDVRLNVDIDRDTLQKIMEQVLVNSNGSSTDYEWMDLAQTVSIVPPKSKSSLSSASTDSRSIKIKKRRNLNNSLTKRSPTFNSTNKIKRSKSTSSVINKSPMLSPNSARQNSMKPQNGIPWRTAARANRFRVSASCAFRKVSATYSDEIVHSEDEESYEENEFVQYVSPRLNAKERSHSMNQRPSKFQQPLEIDKSKDASVKNLLIVLQKEQESKSQLEKILIQIQDENIKLKTQISMLKSELDEERQLNKKHGNNKKSTKILDDEKSLEIIELTLHKYRNFLDFLRNAGFGKLIDIGEMNHVEQLSPKDKKSIKKPKSESKNHQSTQKVPANDQEKYLLNKINKAKSKMDKRAIEYNENFEFGDESFMKEYDHENNNIDTLLTNALEISKSYRIQNNNTNANKGSSKQVKIGDEKSGRHKNSHDQILPSLDDLQESTQKLIGEYKTMKTKSGSRKKSDGDNSENLKSNNLSASGDIENLGNADELSAGGVYSNENSKHNSNNANINKSPMHHHSTASTSPATTVIANSSKNPAGAITPIASARSISSKKVEFQKENDRKASREDEEISEIGSEFEEEEDEEEEEEDYENGGEVLEFRSGIDDMIMDASDLRPAIETSSRR